MALGTIATIATIAAAATSVAGAAYAATQSGPKAPDAASSSRKVAEAQAGALPDMLKLQQLQQQGGKGMVNMPAHQEQQDYVRVPSGTKIDKGNTILGQNLAGVDPIGSIFFGLKKRKKQLYEEVPYVASEWEEGGKYAGLGKPDVFKKTVDVPEGPQEVDFTGYGTADIEGELAKRQADLELKLGEKYGTQFADLARQNAELADPMGTQARALEFEMINRDMPTSALPGMLDEQIRGQVNAGRGYDVMSREMLDKAVAEANAARSGRTMAGDVATSGSTGMEGQGRLSAATNKAGQFLASGVTPEDIAYKRGQQKISNLGAFVNGATPQSQFGALAQAGQGAAPVTGAQANATMPNNASSVGSGYSSSGYSSQVNQSLNQPNSWFAGMSALLNGVGSLKTIKG